MKSFSNQVEFSIEVNGKKVREYVHDGKIYIEGKKGSTFTLKFKNNSWKKLLVVPSVDGLSVIDGKEATSESGGYIVNPYDSLEVQGWRTSLDSVASFIFNEKDRSYANTGSEGTILNCGVIGCRVFEEQIDLRYRLTSMTDDFWLPKTGNPNWTPITTQPNPWPWITSTYTCGATRGTKSARLSLDNTSDGSLSLGNTNPPMPDGAELLCEASVNSVGNSLTPPNQNPDFNLGTEYGDSKIDKVQAVTFNKGTLIQTFELYYSDREGLIKAGIQLQPQKQIFPSAFNDSFCKPPKK